MQSKSYDVVIVGGWMGQIGEIEGLYVCTGWSRGGFKIAPAVGRMIAEEIYQLFK